MTGFDLLLFRHGNTFGPGDPVIRLGRNEDLPLVASGEAQARTAADALAARAVRPAAVYTSPLKRARRFAEIVATGVGASAPVVDERLNELDYGAWSGLTDEAIAARFGQDALDAWNKRGIWPEGAGWGEGEAAVTTRLAAFAADALRRHGPIGTVLAVSSAGTLRYALAALVPEEYARLRAAGGLKIGTGRAVRMRHDGRAWALADWNAAPEALGGTLG